MHYQNHLESVYCVAGAGSIEDRASGAVHAINPGVMYALDKHDRHILRAKTEMTMACVFNPPLNGKEVHDDSGAYPLIAEAVSQ
jgi:L-ectoine synthase